MCPEFLKIGNFVIYWYGVMVAIGVMIGSLVFQRLARRNGYPQELSSQIIFWSVAWGIIGGRALHVAVQFPYYYRNPYEIISIRNGGLAAEGAIISAFIFLCIYSRVRNFNIRRILDMIAVPVPLAQALGRIGCFLNGCCYGKPSTSGFSVKFPYLETRVHPTQLYYAAGHVLIFLFLLHLMRKKPKDGILFSAYIMCFSLMRYLLDNLRGDLLPNQTGLYPTQAIALLMFAGGLFWFISSAKQADTAGEQAERPEQETIPPEKEEKKNGQVDF